MAHAVSWKSRACLLVVSAIIALAFAAGSTAHAAPPPGAGPQAKEGSLIVRLKPGANIADLLPTLSAKGASVDRQLGRGQVIKLALPAGADANALLAALRGNPAVAQAGLDLVARAFDAPNDPGYTSQWNMKTGTGGINVESAWAQSPARGSGVVVAVIDTGVAYENYTGGQGLFGPKTFGRAPDLAGVPIVAPWDWIDGDAHAGDENGHGTHVAGTILEGTNNGLAEAGVSAASLMPLRILDFSGNGVASDLIDAIYYASDHGARVINMSLGFSGTGTPNANGEVCTEIVGLAEALQYADAMGVSVVAASGNDGIGTVACPAAYPTVISVAATDVSGNVTSYSNGGAAITVAAPGGDPNGQQVTQQGYCLDVFTAFLTGRYNEFCDVPMSGTSMASPHVAGVAALLIGQHPTLSPAQTREVITSTARDRGVAGRDSQFGHGIVDAGAAMASIIADPPPLPPPGPDPVPRPVPQPGATGLSATALSASSIRLNWTDAATNETGFRIERSSDSGATWAQAAIVPANAVTWTNSGLAAGTTYAFRVRSYDANGNSPWSSVVTVSTLPPPSTPNGVSALALSATSIRVNWTDTSTGEQGFRVERSTDGITFPTSLVAMANATTSTFNQLTPQTTYWFRVRAYDGPVVSAPSEVVQATTLALPAPPENLFATVLSVSSIRLDWSDKSSSEQYFRVQRSTDGATTWTTVATLLPNTTTWTNNGLTSATTYAYRVMGVDGSLTGAASNVATATTLGAPTPPTNLVALAQSTTRVRLDWVDTSSNEGGFKLEASTNGGTTWIQVATTLANAVTYTANNLVPGTAYLFRARAFSGATNGEYSNVAAATTFEPPAAPSNLTATAVSTTSIRLNWTNSSSIQTGLKVERSLDGLAWTQVAFVGATTTTYTNSVLQPGTAYLFRIRAVETNTNGPYSAEAGASTMAPPPSPTGLGVTSLTATSARLTWTDVCSYESGFRIERSLDGVTWTLVAILGANTSSWTTYGLAAHTTYYFRIRAYEGTINGPNSDPVMFANP